MLSIFPEPSQLFLGYKVKLTNNQYPRKDGEHVMNVTLYLECDVSLEREA